MQKKSRLMSILMLMFVMVISSVCLTACGDDDDEPNDPSIPAVGTWTISSYEDLAMSNSGGRIGRDYWSFWEQEFQKVIAKRKIKIGKNTPMDGGWYILSTDDERNKIGYLNDSEKIEVISVEGKTMTANYYLKQYDSVMDDDAYIIFRATVKLAKK